MKLSIIPKPCILREVGTSFRLMPQSKILFASPGAEAPARLLAGYLRPATGFPLPVSAGKPDPGDIVLFEQGDVTENDAGFVKEKYELSVTKQTIRLSGLNGASLARGIQTLRQLFPCEIYSGSQVNADWLVPGVEITDEPEYCWRGIMLDVCRHFFPKEHVLRFMELAAQHKINVIHLHLTDDQGWRVEIKKYPRLTEVGSIRKRTLLGHESDRPRRYDETPYGGYFTQNDLKEIVAFAAERYMTVMPEIDMPGHMVAAVSAYPELGNFPQNQWEVRDCWGISYQILSPRPATFAFLQDVLKEIMDIFPSKFIHLGGDEAVKLEWEICCEVQQIMREKHCADETDMQAWFLRQMADFLRSHGRRMIGWNEIIQGGLPDGAGVMCWTDPERSAKEALALNHPIVMSPWNYLYLQCCQGNPKYEPGAPAIVSSAERVYSFNPLPDGTSEEKRDLVFGAQAAFWSEYIADYPALEYLAFPRVCAFAEKVWCAEKVCRYPDFAVRMRDHRARLNAQSVNAYPLP